MILVVEVISWYHGNSGGFDCDDGGCGDDNGNDDALVVVEWLTM